MSNISVDTLLQVLPGPLANDKHMTELAEVAARALSAVFDTRNEPNILSRIDELPEDVLDILAEDFKVDWYDYNANLTTKRRVIKSNWYVHKRLGSVRAVETALSDVWPNSTVEEWFDYGGNPFHFHVILDVTEGMNPILLDKTMEMIHLYKPARGILEEGMPIIRVTFGITINTHTERKKYHVDPAGIKPRWSTHGNLDENGINIETGTMVQTYHPPLTGQLTAGTHPNYATHGRADEGGLLVEIDSGHSAYRARPCGTSIHSLS